MDFDQDLAEGREERLEDRGEKLSEREVGGRSGCGGGEVVLFYSPVINPARVQFRNFGWEGTILRGRGVAGD